MCSTHTWSFSLSEPSYCAVRKPWDSLSISMHGGVAGRAENCNLIFLDIRSSLKALEVHFWERGPHFLVI